MVAVNIPPLIERAPSGKLKFNFHHGQAKAWESDTRFIAIIAGNQSGKTEFLPIWLYREIQRMGPGDYLFVSPTLTLMGKKALRNFLDLFVGMLDLGSYVGSPNPRFTLSKAGEWKLWGAPQEEQTHVFFCYAQNSDSLESSTAKGAVCDEAGQKAFRLSSWQAIQRRLSIHQGRALLGTTPYDLGWLKTEFYDRWKAKDKDYQVVNFPSYYNPKFPFKEYQRAYRTLPRWRFDLFYKGIFTRPAGLIYDCFLDVEHVITPFSIPNHWPRYRGLDFGGINTSAVYFAENPENPDLWYGYREYHAGNRTAKEHVEAMAAPTSGLPPEPGNPYRCVGGSKSEQQWRDEFAAAGLAIEAPDQPDVEVGITRVYGGIKTKKVVFFNTMKRTIDQLNSYSRVVDDSGSPTAEIEDKASYHELDGCRYILGWKFRENSGGWGDVQLPSPEETEYYSRAREY